MTDSPRSRRTAALEQQKQAAIRRLDFELAFQITQTLLQERAAELSVEHRRFLEQVALESVDDQAGINAQRQRIEANQEDEVDILKREYSRAARILARKHRQQAHELTEKWRGIYAATQRDVAARVESSNISARILAEASKFESAISVRNGAREMSGPPLAQCCAAFKRQFDFMCGRHEGEFDQLHSLLRNAVLAMKQYGNQVMLTIEAEYARKEAERKAMVLDSMFQMTPDRDTRRAAIARMSPKSVRSSPSSPTSRRSVTRS
jgi:multidrug efflux pump subunit AcrA (membrane-fusion protein)